MNKRTILLVEDDVRFAELSRAFLLNGEGGTHEVALARDGLEAIDYLFDPARDASGVPDLVLLDLNMPRLDGFGVLREVRSEERTMFVPVVVLTSSVHPDDVRRAYSLGANGYLDKLSTEIPWDETLQTVTRYWLGMNLTPHSLAAQGSEVVGWREERNRSQG